MGKTKIIEPGIGLKLRQVSDILRIFWVIYQREIFVGGPLQLLGHNNLL